MKTGLVVGTRGSKLALVQTEMVVDALRRANPGLEVTTVRITTTGDRDQRTELDRMAAGVFVKELETALLDVRIDVAVHSLKDVPIEVAVGLELLATLQRADPRDVLVAKTTLKDLPPGAKIGTGSLRRAIQIRLMRPDLTPVAIRGNVDTRLGKIDSGEVDGVLLAAAGLQRLSWQDRITQYLSPEQFLPAVGQGALVIEARADDKETARLVAPLNHQPTWRSTIAERAFLRTLGGGCRAPIGALGTVSDGILRLEGMIASATGSGIVRDVIEGSVAGADDIGVRLAERLLAIGGARFVAEAQDA